MGVCGAVDGIYFIWKKRFRNSEEFVLPNPKVWLVYTLLYVSHQFRKGKNKRKEKKRRCEERALGYILRPLFCLDRNRNHPFFSNWNNIVCFVFIVKYPNQVGTYALVQKGDLFIKIVGRTLALLPHTKTHQIGKQIDSSYSNSLPYLY